MIKYVCDACGCDIKSGRSYNNIDIPCHLFSERDSSGYVDDSLNNASGRMDSVGVCNKCNNVLLSLLVDKFEEIKSNNDSK